MKVTLRKANAIQTSINDILKSIQLINVINLNEFQDVEQTISTSLDILNVNLDRKLNLLGALNNIRIEVGSKNSSSGIDRELTALATIDKQINLYQGLVVPSSLRKDICVLSGKLAKIRTSQREILMYNRDEVDTGILSQEFIDTLKVKISELKKIKQTIQDRVLELNFKTEVELDEFTITVLTAEGII